VVSHSLWVGGYRTTDRLTIFGGAIIASDGEVHTSFEDTISIGAAAGFSYEVSENLSLGFAAAVQTLIEDDPLLLPLPVVLWKPAIDPERRWSVAVGASPGGPSRVGGAGIEYAATETLTCSLNLRVSGLGANFRLDDEGAVPGGAGRDSSMPVVLGIEWTPRADLSVSAYAGASFLREIEFRDSNGNSVSERDVDPGAIVGVAATIAF
jgi:hypothetical protein